jgi:hypothetical protein
MSTDPALLSALADAIRNAGATEDVIVALIEAGGTFEDVPPKRGRPRQHANSAARKRAWRQRKRDEKDETAPAAEMRDEMQQDAERDEIHSPKAEGNFVPPIQRLRGRLMVPKTPR